MDACEIPGSAPIIAYQFDEDHACSHCKMHPLRFPPAPILPPFTAIERDGSPLGPHNDRK